MTLPPNPSIQKSEPSVNLSSLKDDVNLGIQLDNRGTTILSFEPRGCKPSLAITRKVPSQLPQSSLKDSVNLEI
jgi:hypothetical protein